MNFSLKHALVFALASLAAFVILNTLMTPPAGYAADASHAIWLANFQGGPVNITFLSYADNTQQTVKAKLIRAEISGAVLRLPGQQDKFFPYAHILSIEPL